MQVLFLLCLLFYNLHLDYAKYVRHRPIQNQSRRHPCKHYCEQYRHPTHHTLCLCRNIVARCICFWRLQPLLQVHRRAHQYRQYKVWVHRRQIRYPQEMRISHLNRYQQRLVQCKEYWNLNQHWQAPRHWWCFVRLVQFHHFHLQAHFIICIQFLDAL